MKRLSRTSRPSFLHASNPICESKKVILPHHASLYLLEIFLHPLGDIVSVGICTAGIIYLSLRLPKYVSAAKCAEHGRPFTIAGLLTGV